MHIFFKILKCRAIVGRSQQEQDTIPSVMIQADIYIYFKEDLYWGNEVSGS